MIGRIEVSSEIMLHRYPCPVCNYMQDQWTEPRADIVLSHDICPCCGTQFGYHDFIRSHEDLKWQWVDCGMRWHSDVTVPPEGWDARKQLTTIYMSGRDYSAFAAALG